MKIFFTIPHLAEGGAERVVSLLANYLAEKGHHVIIILLSSNRCSYNLESKVSLIYAGHSAKGGFLKRLFWLRNYVKKEHPDIVISFLIKAYCFTLLALLGVNVCKIVSERVDPRFTKPWFWRVIRRILLPTASHLVVQTEEIKAYYGKNIRKKTSVIFNPVSSEVFRQNYLVERKKIIVTAGRLCPQKNHQMLIEAFRRIADKFPDYQLYIYGEGYLRGNLLKIIRLRGLDKRVILCGRSDRLIEKINETSLFCLSSDYEGMSNSLIEAICLGLPIVTTNVSGTESFMKDGENGIIVKCGDVDGLSRGMERILSESNLRNRMKLNNRKKAELFRIENISKQWEGLFINELEKVQINKST